MTENEIISAINSDEWMLSVLKTARGAGLPDWMIGAGFVRNKIWNILHDFPADASHDSDLDLIYFDPTNVSEEYEKQTEQQLNDSLQQAWSVKNMARMHIKNNDDPYSSTADGLAHWVETATCIAVKLNDANEVELIAPYGIDDLVGLILRPTPHMKHRMQDFENRITKKHWLEKWPKLKIARE